VSLGSRIGDTLRVPGRGVRRIVTVLVVLALAAATGGAVSLTAPGLVAGFGIAQEAAAPPPVPQRQLGPLPAAAPLPTPQGLAAALDGPAGEPELGEFSGVVVDPAVPGRVLWESAPDQPLVPGSAVKLLTGAAALLSLDATDAFVTRAVAGPEPGTVVLVGGGDPTLTALPDGEAGTYPEPTRLTELAAEVRAAVPGPIEQVLVDTSRYTGPELAAGWDLADVPDGFVAPIVPLMLDGGRVDPAEQDGRRFRNPATTAGEAFALLLAADGGPVPEVAEGTAAPDAQPLGAVASAPLTTLVEHVMRSSDNVLAETLAREVAIARGAPATFTGAATEILAALAQAGFDTTGAELADGSGLSVEDRVPARLLGAVLAAAAAPAQGADDAVFLRPVVTGLPVAGGDGTLDERFAVDSAAAAGRGDVRAKTGTLTGVSSLTGIVTDADGRLLVFAFVSNGGSSAAVRPRLDAMATALAGCGCR